MAVPLKSQVAQNPQKLKRKFDKVRDLVDKDEEMKVEEDLEDELEEENDSFELDDLNKHPCMQNILDTIDSLVFQFSDDWEDEKMPGWMEKLHKDYQRSNFSAKLFILKVIINRPEPFIKYSNHWFKYLAEYTISRENGGKGFHYFLRDICTIMICFSETLDISTEENKKY